MIVKCVSQYPTEDQLDYLGPKFFKNQAFHITIGKEYIVLGLSVSVEPDPSGRGVAVEIVTDYGHLGGTPLCLFQIVDGTASRYWEVKVREDGIVTLWPTSFYREYFHDDLSESVPDVVEEFQRVRDLIEAEAIGRTQGGESADMVQSPS
jgi:hypothetical protein